MNETVKGAGFSRSFALPLGSRTKIHPHGKQIPSDITVQNRTIAKDISPERRKVLLEDNVAVAETELEVHGAADETSLLLIGEPTDGNISEQRSESPLDLVDAPVFAGNELSSSEEDATQGVQETSLDVFKGRLPASCCGMLLSQSSTLISHFREHYHAKSPRERGIPCIDSNCPVRLKSTNLALHLKQHVTPANLNCELCTYKTDFSVALRAHYLAHGRKKVSFLGILNCLCV